MLKMLNLYECKEIALGTNRREEEMKIFHNFLRDPGKAGIDTTTYAWHTGGAYKTGTTMVRGCEARLFKLEEAYIFGYIKALIQSVDTELGLVQV